MIKMIMFDMDYTINNWSSKTYSRQISEESGADFATVDRFTSKMIDSLDEGRLRLAQFERSISKRFKVPRSRIKYCGCYERNVKVKSEMIRIIKRLKKRYLTALLTNSERCRYAYTAKIVDLKLFDYTFVSGYIRLLKPHPQIYRYVLKKTKLKSDEILFIDNNTQNVIGARKVGIESIHFIGAKKLEEKLKRLGIW